MCWTPHDTSHVMQCSTQHGRVNGGLDQSMVPARTFERLCIDCSKWGSCTHVGARVASWLALVEVGRISVSETGEYYLGARKALSMLAHRRNETNGT